MLPILPDSCFPGYRTGASGAPEYSIDSWFINLKSASGISKQLASDTKNKILQCLSNILSMAVTQGLIEENPCEKVEKNAEHNKEREPMTQEEMEILFPLNSR
jgi:site-specific recombinase XerD